MRYLILLFLFVCNTVWGDGTSGLAYSTYRGTGAYPNYTTLTYPTALSTGVSANINYNWGGGVVLNSGRADQVLVHWTGYVLWPGTGSKTVTFYNSSDDGFILKINNTVVINNWVEQGNAIYNSSGSITLTGGTAYYIDIWYYENGGGAVAQLYWNLGSGIVIVPSTNYASSATYWAPAYSSNITGAQSARYNTAHSTQVNLPSTSHIYIDQIGNNDNVTINQHNQYNNIGGNSQTAMKIRGGNNTIVMRQGDPNNTNSTHNDIAADLLGGSNNLTVNQGTDANGYGNGQDTGYHYLSIYVNGINNVVSARQQNTGTTTNSVGHYAEINITGNQNNQSVVQTGNAPKQLFSSINGNGNTMTTTQSGLGEHYLDLSLTGNGNTATVTQTGDTQNRATISLTNAGGPAGIDLTQTGGQVYNITTVCVTLGGCGTVTVRQGN